MERVAAERELGGVLLVEGVAVADAEQERALFRREIAGEDPRIGIIDVDARNVADRGKRARTALRPPCSDAMVDGIVENDVTRIVAIRTAVLA